MMKPAAVLFDFDGVVVDSFNSHSSAWRKAYSILFGHEMPAYPRENLTGAPSSVIGAFLAESSGYGKRTSELCELKLKILLSGEFLPELLPGAQATFELLTAKRIPFGIASNAPKSYVRATVDALNLKCSLTLGFEDYTKPKPDPEPYILCARQLGIDSDNFNNVVVFEDSAPGITAAIEADMQAIGISSGGNSDELQQLGAKYTFPSLQAVLDENIFSFE